MKRSNWGGIAIMLQDRTPSADHQRRFIAWGRIEVSPKGSPRVDLYDLLGVRNDGRDLYLRYAGRRDGGVTTGLPLAGSGSDPTPFWTARREDMTVILYAGLERVREGRLDQ